VQLFNLSKYQKAENQAERGRQTIINCGKVILLPEFYWNRSVLSTNCVRCSVNVCWMNIVIWN